MTSPAISCKPLVTPFTGVWIEIPLWLADYSSNGSLPSRECGLKFLLFCDSCVVASSLPSRECGLKYRLLMGYRQGRKSLPSRECGLKWAVPGSFPARINCHSLHGSVDWNSSRSPWRKNYLQSLPSRECGLKCRSNILLRLWTCHSLTGVLIEIALKGGMTFESGVTPFMGVWIQIVKVGS